MKAILALSGALLLAACSTNQKPLGATFGEAHAANFNAQVIDQTPAEGAPMGDGATTDIAIMRYKTDTVKKGNSGEFTPENETEEGSK